MALIAILGCVDDRNSVQLDGDFLHGHSAPADLDFDDQPNMTAAPPFPIINDPRADILILGR